MLQLNTSSPLPSERNHWCKNYLVYTQVLRFCSITFLHTRKKKAEEHINHVPGEVTVNGSPAVANKIKLEL